MLDDSHRGVTHPWLPSLGDRPRMRPAACSNGVSEGLRTLDPRSHSPVLYQLSYTHHDNRYSRYTSAPEGTRTPDLRLRRPLLYPPELLARAGTREVPAIGARGFEPPTPCAQGRCATRLRHAPSILAHPAPTRAGSSPIGARRFLGCTTVPRTFQGAAAEHTGTIATRRAASITAGRIGRAANRARAGDDYARSSPPRAALRR
jgi:hypothetical protein